MYIEEILLKKIESLLGTRKLVFQIEENKYSFCLKEKKVTITKSGWYCDSERAKFGRNLEKHCIEILSKIINNLEEHKELVKNATDITTEIKEIKKDKIKNYIFQNTVHEINTDNHLHKIKQITEEGYL